MKVDSANGKEVMRQLQYLTMVLMSMYGHRDLVSPGRTLEEPLCVSA